MAQECCRTGYPGSMNAGKSCADEDGECALPGIDEQASGLRQGDSRSSGHSLLRYFLNRTVRGSVRPNIRVMITPAGIDPAR